MRDILFEMGVFDEKNDRKMFSRISSFVSWDCKIWIEEFEVWDIELNLVKIKER